MIKLTKNIYSDLKSMSLVEIYKNIIHSIIVEQNNNQYIYHGTNTNSGYHIKKSGGMKINSANNNEPYISFTSKLNVAEYYADMKGGYDNGVILRTIKTPDFKLSDKFKNNKGYWVTKKEIPISELEINTKEFGWIPLLKWDFIDKKII